MVAATPRLLIEWVRGAFLDNLGLKLLSLAFALGLYAFSHGADDAQRTFSVFVVSISPPESSHRVLVSPPPPTVRLTVRGSRALLDDLRAEDIGNLQLDLRAGQIEHIVLDASMVTVPPGVRAEQVDPPFIDLKWDDELFREVPIQASITGQPAPGFVVRGAPRVEPGSVHARGPRSMVEVVQHARAESFDVSGLTAEGTYDRALAIDRPASSRVVFDVQSAVVKVDIAREELQRLFVKVPVQLVGLNRGMLVPSEVDVRVEGIPELVRGLRTEQIVPTVDLRAAGVNLAVPGSAKVAVHVDLEHCKTTVQPQAIVVRW